MLRTPIFCLNILSMKYLSRYKDFLAFNFKFIVEAPHREFAMCSMPSDSSLIIWFSCRMNVYLNDTCQEDLIITTHSKLQGLQCNKKINDLKEAQIRVLWKNVTLIDTGFRKFQCHCITISIAVNWLMNLLMSNHFQLSPLLPGI